MSVCLCWSGHLELCLANKQGSVEIVWSKLMGLDSTITDDVSGRPDTLNVDF